MVKICSSTYPLENEEKYKDAYAQYSYPLHDFQKWTVEAIVSQNHVLICAPTGSGKTFGGDFALSFFHKLGKKTIYTCPIKALSNEKYYQFSQKYPEIRFGLITGDIRCNPDADVLIMTTEILMNRLFQLKNETTVVSKNKSFDMNIAEELGCVVFDEIHMIADESRGTVWENTLMMLPHHIQIVGLSATLSNPEKFAHWIETRHPSTVESNKIVYLTKKSVRAVPLTHYMFITFPMSVFKTNINNKNNNKNVNSKFKSQGQGQKSSIITLDKSVQDRMKRIINKPVLLQTSDGKIHDENLREVSSLLQAYQKYSKMRVKRAHVLNQLFGHMVQEEMFPALCYVYSRKQLEVCAHEVTANLLEFDSKVPYTVDHECEQLLRSRLTNFEEYLHLPEYVNLVALLQKGIGIHHAGMMPVLKEIVELLFARGFIKVLFSTETMSVGINLPVKTTIFTDVCKFSGGDHRWLHSFEMTQAAGRAGRLGIDTVGNVIHLNNLFPDKTVQTHDYKKMLSGVPQQLISRFRVSYSLILQSLMDCNDNDREKQLSHIVCYAEKSMITDEYRDELDACQTKLTSLKSSQSSFTESLLISDDVIRHYMEYCELQPHSINRRRKEIDKELLALRTEYTTDALEYAVKQFRQQQVECTHIQEVESQIQGLKTFVSNNVNVVYDLLHTRHFIENTEDTTCFNVSLLGRIALQLHELPSLPLAELICQSQTHLKDSYSFVSLTAVEYITVLSCFTSIRVSDDQRIVSVPNDINENVRSIVIQIQTTLNTYMELESQHSIESGEEYEIQFDLIPFMDAWCNADNVESCKKILQDLKDHDIFLGEFVKALLKIVNIALELESVAELLGNLEWLSVLKEIPKLIMKYVVTNQSLYV